MIEILSDHTTNLFILQMLTAIFVALITAVFGPIFVSWVKNKLETNKNTKGPIEEALDVNNLIDEQLDIIQQELKCDRTWIIQFHNGGHFYPSGKAIQKFSMFYEKISPANQPSIQTFQNIPVSLFSKALSKVYEDGELTIPSCEDIKHYYDLQPITKRLGTKSIYMVSLDDLKEKFIGVLSVSFKNPRKLTEDEWNFLQQKSGIIGALLDSYLNKQK